MIFGLAVLFDLALGSKRLTGWLPNLDKIFFGIASFLKQKLDRPNRSTSERFVRGIIVLLAVPTSLGLLGKWLIPFSMLNGTTIALSMLILVPLVGQRTGWDNLLGGQGGVEQAKAAQGLITGFADKVVVNALMFAIGGFALLLPYRFLRAQICCAPADYAESPDSPYLALSWRLAELMALPGSWLAAFLIATAHIFIPGTQLTAFAGLFGYRKAAMPSRYWPLSVTARGLGLSFRFSPTKGKAWIGTKVARAKQDSADRRRIGLVLVVALLLALLVSLMLLAAAFA